MVARRKHNFFPTWQQKMSQKHRGHAEPATEQIWFRLFKFYTKNFNTITEEKPLPAEHNPTDFWFVIQQEMVLL